MWDWKEGEGEKSPGAIRHDSHWCMMLRDAPAVSSFWDDLNYDEIVKVEQKERKEQPGSGTVSVFTKDKQWDIYYTNDTEGIGWGGRRVR